MHKGFRAKPYLLISNDVKWVQRSVSIEQYILHAK